MSCFRSSHQLLRWFQRCFRVSHLFGVPSPRKMDSTNRTHIPRISRAPTIGTNVVGKIATTANMMCPHVLMAGATFCLDCAVHAILVVDALPTISPCVDIFHVDPSHSRDRVERRVRNMSDESCGLGTDWWTCDESRGSVHSCQRSWMQSTSCATRQRTWNVLTTWPIQSALTEAPFLCAREGKTGMLTNCADTTRLVGRSRCFKSGNCQRLVQSSLVNLFVSHEVCLWNISIQDHSVHSCDPPDVDEATAFPSEEDDAIREWRQEFPEQTTRAISRIHTNLGHPQISTFAKMISDAGGSEKMIKCATQYPCSVCKRMSVPRLRRPVSVPRIRQFSDTLLADVHFGHYQGREVLVYSLIDEATRSHVTQSARDLYEAIMSAWVKWARSSTFSVG